MYRKSKQFRQKAWDFGVAPSVRGQPLIIWGRDGQYFRETDVFFSDFLWSILFMDIYINFEKWPLVAKLKIKI